MKRSSTDPWQYLADHHPSVEIFIKPLTTFGETAWNDDGSVTIYLAHDLGRPERRCTLAHEIQHIEAGMPCQSLCPNNERDVVERTARWLLPDLLPVARALRHKSIEDAAWQLDVMPSIILDRLDCLTRDEIAEWDNLMGQPNRDVATAAFTPERRTYQPVDHPCMRKDQ